MPPTAVDGYHVDISYEAFEPRRIDMMMLLPEARTIPKMTIPRRRRIVMIVNDHIPSMPPVNVGTRLNIDRPRHAILRVHHQHHHHDYCCCYWVRTRSGVPVGHVAAPGPDQDCAAARTTVPPWEMRAEGFALLETKNQQFSPPQLARLSLLRDGSRIDIATRRNRAWYDE